MVDSNVQRENILPSEKAFAYKMKLEAVNRQGKRSDLTSSPVGTRLRSDQLLALRQVLTVELGNLRHLEGTTKCLNFAAGQTLMNPNPAI